MSIGITNTGSRPCYLFGYPGVAFLDASDRTLPFVYRRGGDQVVTAQGPTHVNLAAGGSAYVTINKYRCDLAEKAKATVINLTPPDLTESLRFALPQYVSVAYCGPDDPGSTVVISPVAATPAGTRAA